MKDLQKVELHWTELHMLIMWDDEYVIINNDSKGEERDTYLSNMGFYRTTGYTPEDIILCKPDGSIIMPILIKHIDWSDFYEVFSNEHVTSKVVGFHYAFLGNSYRFPKLTTLAKYSIDDPDKVSLYQFSLDLVDSKTGFATNLSYMFKSADKLNTNMDFKRMRETCVLDYIRILSNDMGNLSRMSLTDYTFRTDWVYMHDGDLS